MPADPSSPRLGERSLTLLDDLSAQGVRKEIFGEVDVLQFDETHELYAHMNINYVRLDALPPCDRWGEALEPLVRGDFFTSTGEVLLSEVDLGTPTDDRITARVQVDWTFPLRFAEIVWGTGTTTHRQTIPLAHTRPFGSDTVEWTVDAEGWDWAHVAVGDVAANGAFVNPTWRD